MLVSCYLYYYTFSGDESNRMIYNQSVCPHPFTLALIRGQGQTRRQRDFVRTAVRAVTQDMGRLLMVYSARDGDYKFPGGGVQSGEKHAEALARELREEAGRQLSRITALLGVTIELDISPVDSRSTFRMISFYYLCELDAATYPLSLDRYEKALGFSPAWVTLEKALENNQHLRNRAGWQEPFWLARETAVLQTLRSMYVSGLTP